MRTFIIFLDIDGVFNCELFFVDRQKKALRKEVKKGKISSEEYYSSMICKDRMGWFNELVDELSNTMNVEIVISSTWRNNPDIVQILKDNGATFDIIGITGNSESRIRGVEIHEWLKANITVEKHGCLHYDYIDYAIIDDDSDMLLNQGPNFFQTSSYAGLTPNVIHQIRRFALKQSN